MQRLIRTVSAAFVGLAALLTAGPAVAQQPRVSEQGQQARLTSGAIAGIVSDENGTALSGALVSALGGTLASTRTDELGRFTLRDLPPGEYLLRAHMRGFGASNAAVVRVDASPAFHSLQLRRTQAPVGTGGTAGAEAETDASVRARPIVAAGFGLPLGPEREADAETDTADAAGDHPHTETAWRLRHIRRSILKDSAPISVFTGGNDDLVADGSVFGRAVGSAAGLASALFTDFPFSGEVNILTTGAVAPGEVLSATAFPRGIAYLALAAPGTGGDWMIRAAMSEGDLSSWIVAGAFTSRPGSSHTYDFGLSYSTQEYVGGNPAALAAVSEGSRNVGELYAYDRWRLARSVAVDYGARYAHHDYLQNRGNFSPKVGVTLEPLSATRVRVGASQRMLAPGAEEFLSTGAPGPSLPPERTFAPLGAPGEAAAFRVERARTIDLVLERDIGADYVLGVGRFHQLVDDQLVTMFGLNPPDGPRSVGHYHVGNAGGFEADGWVVRFDTPAAARLQGSIHYSLARARWTGHGDVARLLPVAPAMLRRNAEDLHDLTSTVRADISETATRVFVIYKLNTGYVRSNTALERPGLDGRFELQVNQSLPVTFGGTRWELLLGLRNLFRDPDEAASVYDELLVVKPPMRLVGGFLVRF
jgi:hypothetical protein